MKNFDRRKFLKLGSFTTLGSLLTFKTGYAAGTNCQLTTPDILGPYYKENPPFRTKISADNEPGEKLVIKGVVYDISCKPIPGIIVDVWQANATGQYDLTDKYMLRGKMQTNTNGEYEFETVLPGAYDSGGGNYRPKHIHFKVYGQGFQELTTQLYFKDDPYIKTDYWASQPAAEHRIIPLDKDTENILRGSFDIYVDSVTGIHKPDPADSVGYLIQNYPNPFKEFTTIRFGVFNTGEVKIVLSDSQGNHLKTLVNESFISGRYTVNWDGTNEAEQKFSGLVICQMYIDNQPFKNIKMIVS